MMPLRTTDALIDRPGVRAWCLQWLHAAPMSTLFEHAHLGWTAALELEDGHRVVVKIRPWADRVAGCFAVQTALFDAGFPCPQPLVGPTRFGNGCLATAEAYVEHGSGARAAPDAGASARLLATLVALAPAVDAVPMLAPTPPWVGWDHDSDGIWPVADDLDVDLNATRDPAWVDDIGRRVRAILLQQPQTDIVVGHADWEAHNMAWNGSAATAVWDWDSVAALSQAAIVGAAAAVYPSSPDGTVVAATVAETERFLDAYIEARGRRWTDDAVRIMWAAGLWVLSYNAKKEALGGGSGYLMHLRAEGSRRLSRAVG